MIKVFKGYRGSGDDVVPIAYMMRKFSRQSERTREKLEKKHVRFDIHEQQLNKDSLFLGCSSVM